MHRAEGGAEPLEARLPLSVEALPGRTGSPRRSLVEDVRHLRHEIDRGVESAALHAALRQIGEEADDADVVLPVGHIQRVYPHGRELWIENDLSLTWFQLVETRRYRR